MILLLMLIFSIYVPVDGFLPYYTISLFFVCKGTHATASPTQTESYKKTNGLDYPVNVARWADGLQKLQNTSFSSEMWRDRLFPRILSSHLMLNSIQGERKLMLTILAAVSKSNSQNNFSARTSSPHFWI